MIPHGQIYPYPSPNFFANDETPIQAVCHHGTAGSGKSALAVLTDPQPDNPDARVSSNFLILKNGEIYLLVDYRKKRRAWANGPIRKPDPAIRWLAAVAAAGRNPNRCTVSVEHEATSDEMRRRAPMPDAQFNSSTWLTLTLLQELGLPISDQTVIGHRQINSVDKAYCPGVIDIPAYIDVLKLRAKML